MDSIFEEKKNNVYDLYDHTLLEKIDGDKFKYHCGSCGRERTGRYFDLMRPKATKFCGKYIDPGRRSEVIE